MQETLDSRDSADPEPAPRPWLRDAELAQQEFSVVARGQREQQLQKLAKKYSVTANTLRRYLAAATALERISKKTGLPAESLGRLPLTTVEALGRWVEHNVTAATEAATAAIAGDRTVGAVVPAELAARRAAGAKAATWGKTVKADMRTRLAEILRPPGTDLAPRSESRNEGVDLIFRAKDRPFMAVLIFGPYQDEQAYKQRRVEFVQRLLGLGLIYEKVVAVVPVKERNELEVILNNYGRAIGRHSTQVTELLQHSISFFTTADC